MFALQHLFRGFHDLANAASRPHADLRRRLSGMFSLTLIATAIGTVALYLVERQHPSSDIKNIWDAFYYTASQMTTMSAPMSNPVTRAGQAIVLVIDLYAITVVATLAGMFGAFFHHLSSKDSAAAATDQPGTKVTPES